VRTIGCVDTLTEALLFALLGGVLGAGVVVAWRVSEHQLHRLPPQPDPVLPPGVATVLGVLLSSAVVVVENDLVL
jgi:two-component system sensor histidine kinase SenX3